MSTIDKHGGRYLLVKPLVTKNQRRLWQLVRWVERICLACGLGLLAMVGAIRLERSMASQAALKAFSELESSASSPHPETISSSLPSGMQPPAAGVAASPKAAATRGSRAPLAVLEIPKIHLEVPVMNGTDALTLNHAVGRIVGTARLGEPGNIGIAGHRDTFFRGLKDLQKGDAIELRTEEGTDRYIVDEIQIVTPQNISVLSPRARSSITLVTCYPFHFVGNAPQRYIVMASHAGGRTSGLRQ